MARLEGIGEPERHIGSYAVQIRSNIKLSDAYHTCLSYGARLEIDWNQGSQVTKKSERLTKN